LYDGSRRLLQVFRYIVAILVAFLVGQIVQAVVAIFIDIMVGSEVTAGRWPLNAANIILICIQGATVGFVAGAIAKKRGMLISAIAVFFPILALSLLEVIENRDMSEYIATIYDTKPALWAWVALIPATISGHFFSKAARQHEILPAASIVYVICCFVGATAFHFYTAYVAYDFYGGMAAFVTFAAPLLSELYWFINVWHSTGIFLNDYTIRLLACVVMLIFGGAALGVLGLIDKRSKSKMTQSQLRRMD